MKKIIVLFVFIVLFGGCAQIGPCAVDPRVYQSSTKLAVAKNDTKTEVLLSEQLSEQLARQRAIKRQDASADLHEETIDLADSSGGVPVVFINSSSYNKTLIIKKLSGIDKNSSWMFDLKNKNNPHAQNYSEFALEPGFYTAQWVVEGYSTLYPQKGPDTFRVRDREIFFWDKTNKRYFGFYFLYD